MVVSKERVILFLLYFLIVASSSTCDKKPRIKSISVHYESLDYETPFDITCGEFEKSFSGKIDSIVINRENQLRKFQNYLDRLKPSSRNSLNVRIKVYIQYLDGRNSILCMDQFGNIFLDNTFYNESKQMLNFFKSKIGQK